MEVEAELEANNELFVSDGRTLAVIDIYLNSYLYMEDSQCWDGYFITYWEFRLFCSISPKSRH